MNYQSEQIGELAKALSIAQGQIEGALKTKKGNYTKYATLADVWDCCRAPLSSNGLAVVQTFDVINEKNYIISTLLHTSGQWIKSTMLMPVISPKVHDLMSSVTYCRRYTLCALVGVAPIDEDDDGQKAQDSAKHEKPKPKDDHSIDSLCQNLIEFSKDDIQDYVKMIALKMGTSESDVVNQAMSSDERFASFREKLKQRLEKNKAQP